MNTAPQQLTTITCYRCRRVLCLVVLASVEWVFSLRCPDCEYKREVRPQKPIDTRVLSVL